ncbi:MAG: ATP-binding cassette domain-containing protein [Burkholderiaceae bacterium]|nr:ATP-binding cassette domain-containing protein [Burkholderiaceae bacterium]
MSVPQSSPSGSKAGSLSVQHLRKSFGGVKAVDGVTFEIAPGEVAALIGPNGAGKSTLFNLIDGQLVPDGGRVLFDGQPLGGIAAARRARFGIGRTFQVAQIFGTMTALQNLQLALVAAAGETLGVKDLLWNLHADTAHALLAQVGLQSRASSAAANLAYGDAKRLELALALAARPRLLLMDEPTAGMAPEERQALMQLVVGIASVGNMAVLFTEHSMDVVFGFARRVLVLSQGRLIADCLPQAVRANADVQRVYLGDAE